MAIHVSYGPPGVSGVQTLIGLGADEATALVDKRDQMLVRAGWIGVGAMVGGVVTGKKRLSDVGKGAALAAFLIRYVTR